MIAESELMILKAKIEMSIVAYEIQLEKLKEEKETENDEQALNVLDRWIFANEKRIELLTDLKK